MKRRHIRRQRPVRNICDDNPLVTGVYYVTETQRTPERGRIYMFYVVAPRSTVQRPLRGSEGN